MGWMLMTSMIRFGLSILTRHHQMGIRRKNKQRPCRQKEHYQNQDEDERASLPWGEDGSSLDGHGSDVVCILIILSLVSQAHRFRIVLFRVEGSCTTLQLWIVPCSLDCYPIAQRPTPNAQL
jgi:hypothetical protein